MAADVVMPRLSDSMEEGTILKWLKQPGDAVAVGDELAEIETDKATMSCEADAEGTLLEIVVGEGESAPLGALIARIGAPGETNGGGRAPSAPAPAEAAPASADASPAAAAAAAPAPAAAAAPAPAPAAAAAPVAGATERPRAKASPVARRLARELGVDLGALAGSGPRGRIVKADVVAASAGRQAAAASAPEAAASAQAAPAAEAPAPAVPAVPAAPAGAVAPGGKGDVARVEPTRIQQTIARRMAEAKSTQPEFVLRTEADMEEAVALRGRLKELAAAAGRPAPSYNDLVVRACALALREHPRANGAYRDGGFELYGRINVGVAVAAEDALLVPVVHDADRMSLGEIARETRALAEAGRDGTLTAAQLSGGTFTVSNLGMFGVTGFTAVLNSPQAAILAVGALAQRAVVHDGQLGARHRLELSLTCDHRILYGADAAAFLARVRELLEQPLALAL